MVPCSRSRISAEPVRTMASMVILLMIAITAPKRSCSVRIKTHPDRQLYRQHAVIPIAGDKTVYFAGDNILDVTVAGKGLTHARGVDVDWISGCRPASTSRWKLGGC